MQCAGHDPNKEFILMGNIFIYMGIGQYVAKEIMKELSNRSREFYEFVLPPVDIVEDTNDLVVTIDLPGFAKRDIKLRIVGDVLSISAKREEAEDIGTVYYKHRPIQIDKKIPLPISVGDEDEQITGTAIYQDGVVILRIPIPSSSTIPIT
jgi:HSP20 family protein